MPIYRATIAFPMDSALPRDEICINPHYSGTDAQLLANSLKANLIACSYVATAPFKIKVYDATKAPPSYPLATAEQVATPRNSSTPREVALCLSYYAQFNRPTFRGRVYLHPILFGGGAIDVRPSGTQRTNALSWKGVLGTGLPPSTYWGVYSRKTGGMSQITNVWVDDEWDTMRSRGMRSTTRTTATLP